MMGGSPLARIARGGADALREFLPGTPPPVAAPRQPPGKTQALAPAAVLLPIIARAEPSVLFTRRCAHLTRHAGQICFPGGRAEPDDASPVETALRETREETGIDPALVTIAGFLDRHDTGTGYAIQPVVGWVTPDFTLVPQAREVDAIFEVPLAFLLDPANVQEHRGSTPSGLRHYYSFTYQGQRIWGATAAMMINFGARLRAW
jgi:8-oxo-dGTP pyrophosphatase MutT (NUDIX family)